MVGPRRSPGQHVQRNLSLDRNRPRTPAPHHPIGWARRGPSIWGGVRQPRRSRGPPSRTAPTRMLPPRVGRVALVPGLRMGIGPGTSVVAARKGWPLVSVPKLSVIVPAASVHSQPASSEPGTAAVAVRCVWGVGSSSQRQRSTVLIDQRADGEPGVLLRGEPSRSTPR